MQRPALQICLLALAQVLAMTQWFSATAVLPQLRELWQLGGSEEAWLTSAVQLGFVCGALGLAWSGLADALPARQLAAGATLGTAVCTWVLASSDPGYPGALGLRFATGLSLAAVYPPGMKLAVSHSSGRHRGLAIAIIVGSLTLGSASPHLLAQSVAGVAWQDVLRIAAGCGLAAALIFALLVRQGAQISSQGHFDPSQLRRVLGNRRLRLINLGYLGHMWELYAMWAWLLVFLRQGVGDDPAQREQLGLVAFAAIGLAGMGGALAGGWLADRYGRARLCIAAMLVSGACCLGSPLLYGSGLGLLLPFTLLWGAAAIADSAQFSAAASEAADPDSIGTALTLQTCLGFALTLCTIQGLPLLATSLGSWQYAFLALAPGPLLGCLAMARLGGSEQAV